MATPPVAAPAVLPRLNWADRLAAWRAARLYHAHGFASAPLPQRIGHPDHGRELLAGRVLLAGDYMELTDTDPWRLEMPGPDFEDALHGFGWLDDLAALGSPQARVCAQSWAWAWIDRFDDGNGPGWTAALTGRRMSRLIDHAVLLLRGRAPRDARTFARTLARQAAFLARRWPAAPRGLPRLEALCGLVDAGVMLRGRGRLAMMAKGGLEAEAATLIEPDGGIATRNPEDLLEALALLTRAAEALDNGHDGPGAAHRAAILRAVPVLRGLRHADGALARFNGAGSGAPGRLDRALAAARSTAASQPGVPVMGYGRLTGGAVSVIVDGAAPPIGPASASAHAGALAFEMTCGTAPLIVNCGSGRAFGETWRQAGRATPSHTVLAVDGVSSSRFGADAAQGAARLATVPGAVSLRLDRMPRGQQAVASHDGYVPSHGLVHHRTLLLSENGAHLSGQDVLEVPTRACRARLSRESRRIGAQDGLPVTLRFHLHPDVAATLEDGTVALAPPGGAGWRFHHDGRGRLSLEPSVYLEPDMLKPRATRQIVLRTGVGEAGASIGWTLARAEGTPQTVRNGRG